MSSKLPLVSIVIPVYNREVLLKTAINSAIQQTYTELEIVIIDNCSTDNTYEVAKEYADKYPQIKLIKNNENIGPVNNWIEGIRNANGEYIKLLFSDDWISEDYIEKTVSHFNKDVGLVFTSAIIKKSAGDKYYYKLFGTTRKITSGKFISLMLLTYKTPLSPGCAIFRKIDILPVLSLVIDINEHDKYLRYGAGLDVLTFLITAENYASVVYASDTYAYFLEHDDSFTYANSLDRYYIKAFDYFLKLTKKVDLKLLYKLLHRSKIYKFIGFFSNK